jgi:dimethylhistidine N-methyltransferase
MTALAEASEPRLLRDVIDGLSRPQKTLPCQWLYDQRGSELFEDITRLPEYYPTRTEIGIMRANVDAIASVAGAGATLVEYGAGAALKTRLLLNALDEPAAYVPIDVSGPFLEAAATSLRADYPGLRVTPVVADFLAPLSLPDVEGTGTRIGFFPGSTIGNLSDNEIRAFLSRARDDLGDRALFVLGFDLKKDPAILIPAYDDAAGITAAFNRNILTRINRELGATFAVDDFAHEARWNPGQSRIEMHLVGSRDQSVRVGERTFFFNAGESIHTENSRKFDIAGVKAASASVGWATLEAFTDPDGLFAVALMRAA